VTPLGALPILVRALEGVDLCLTIDTFTAHLVPLFGVPTVTITDRDNRDFWVPAPWSIHHVVERPDAGHLDFVARILAALAEPAAAGLPAGGSVPALLSATRRAADEGLHAETIAAVHDALASVLRAGPALLYRRQGQEWLLAWSYLASAVRREPTDAGSLAPYLHHWRQSPFLKLAGLCAAARSASSSSPTA
jgi:hypothetical protein